MRLEVNKFEDLHAFIGWTKKEKSFTQSDINKIVDTYRLHAGIEGMDKAWTNAACMDAFRADLEEYWNYLGFPPEPKEKYK